MNDFTKEELMTLSMLCLKDIHWLREKSECGDLRDKIQGMINNYCEHEKYTPVLGGVDCFQCHKCNEIILK